MSHSRKRRNDEHEEMRHLVPHSPKPRHALSPAAPPESSNTVRFLCIFFTLALLLLVLVALAVISNSEDAFVTDTATFRPQDFQRTLSASSTGSFQPSSTAGSSGTAAPPLTAGQQQAVPDPACLVSNVEIGFAQCSNRITTGFSTDTLFSPNATYDLGRCIVPYMHTNLRQFVAVRTPSLMAGQFWQLAPRSNLSNIIAQYTRESSMVQYINNNATNMGYQLTTQLTDSNPAYYYRTKARECASVISFILDFETCVCLPGAQNGTTSSLNEFCDCSGFSAPIVLDPSLQANSTSYSSSSSSSTAGSAPAAATALSFSSSDSFVISSTGSDASTQDSSISGFNSLESSSTDSSSRAADSSTDFISLAPSSTGS